jgi:Flp pilus assembly protein TadG
VIRRRARERGQGLVEFAMLVPVFLLLLLGILEFGLAFDHAMTINYATREGARGGAAFASGNETTMICGSSVDVDKHIVAAVQRVLDAPGSQVDTDRIAEIRIYRAAANGTQVGSSANVWTYAAGAGPAVDGENLDFQASTTNWNACTRNNAWNGTTAPDSIGVSIRYSYAFATPLASIFGFFGESGGATLAINDRTVMALNPTD